MIRIILISSFLIIFFSCQEKAIEENSDQSNTEEVSSSNIPDIKKNDKIEFGTLLKKEVSQKVKTTGHIEIPPTSRLSVYSKTEGLIEYMKFLPGDFVKRGSLLFRISNQTLIEKQRILLETKAELWMANQEFKRKETLKNENAISSKVYDEAYAKKELLTARFKGLKKELQQVGIHTEKLLEEGTFQSSVPIYSVNSGYVHEVYVNKGQMISPDNRLMDLANNQNIHLELQVLAKDVPLLELGQNVEFTLPKMSRSLKASVQKINPILNEESGTLMVHCHVNDKDCEYIIPGMFVNAEIMVEDREVLGLPLDAVINEGQSYFAYTLEKGNLEKTLLNNPYIINEFITFDPIGADSMIIKGAYYIDN